ncbi:hypothetical protein EHI42_10535 [Rhizobium hidalgonense]|nr:hypothetical protein EHI42_10535 [Rhizobium hidalgonense]
MKEVRSVLHAIFRCLLKRLDETELRRRGRFRQGKTCPLIHISNFVDWFQPPLWTMWSRLICRDEVHSLSTAAQKIVRAEEFGIIFRFSVSPNFRWASKILPIFFAGARQMASAVDGF